MTENYYTTETYDKEHIHFGGLIFYSDFNTDYRGNDQKESSIAKRIASDIKEEKRCLKIYENNKRMKENN